MNRAIIKEMEQFNIMLRRAIQSDRKLLQVVTQNLLTPSGKQMRPMLVLLTAALHGEVNEKSYAAAILFEMLHWSTLIHDDVVDEAYIRRGELTLGALTRSKKAVLIGDYMFTRGLAVAARAENFHTIVTATRAIEDIVDGELLQSDHATKLSTTREDYFEIIRLKTAVMIAAAAEAGADSAGATPEQKTEMYRFGELVGYAFQIQDDLLDMESASTSGKILYNDLRERKITLPLIYAMEQAGRKEAMKHLRLAAGDPKSIAWLLRFINDHGGMEHSKEQMNQLHHQAMEILAAYPPSNIKDSLTAYCDYVVGRKR